MPDAGFLWYNIAEAHEFLVITGAGVEDVRIVKKAVVLPWQKVRPGADLSDHGALVDHL